jgi:hypothetical protein
MREDFYSSVLQAAESAGVVDPTMSVLVVAGGGYDRDVFLARGYRQVTISNVDTRIDTSGAYAPYTWSYQNAESLSAEGEYTGRPATIFRCRSVRSSRKQTAE